MKAQDLAHYIINRSIDNQTYIGNLQLQKILSKYLRKTPSLR